MDEDEDEEDEREILVDDMDGDLPAASAPNLHSNGHQLHSERIENQPLLCSNRRHVSTRNSSSSMTTMLDRDLSSNETYFPHRVVNYDVPDDDNDRRSTEQNSVNSSSMPPPCLPVTNGHHLYDSIRMNRFNVEYIPVRSADPNYQIAATSSMYPAMNTFHHSTSTSSTPIDHGSMLNHSSNSNPFSEFYHQDQAQKQQQSSNSDMSFPAPPADLNKGHAMRQPPPYHYAKAFTKMSKQDLMIYDNYRNMNYEAERSDEPAGISHQPSNHGGRYANNDNQQQHQLPADSSNESDFNLNKSLLQTSDGECGTDEYDGSMTTDDQTAQQNNSHTNSKSPWLFGLHKNPRVVS